MDLADRRWPAPEEVEGPYLYDPYIRKTHVDSDGYYWYEWGHVRYVKSQPFPGSNYTTWALDGETNT